MNLPIKVLETTEVNVRADILSLLIFLLSSMAARGATTQPLVVPSPGTSIDVDFSEVVVGSLADGDVPRWETLAPLPTRIVTDWSLFAFAGERIWTRMQIHNPSDTSTALVLTSVFPIYSQWLVANIPGAPMPLARSGINEAESMEGTLLAAMRFDIPPGTTTFFIGTKAAGAPFQPKMSLQRFEDFNKSQEFSYAMAMIAMGFYLCSVAFVLSMAAGLKSKIFAQIGIAGVCALPLLSLLDGQAYILPVRMRALFLEYWHLSLAMSVYFTTAFARGFIGINVKTFPKLDWILSVAMSMLLVISTFYQVSPRLITSAIIAFVVILLSTVLTLASIRAMSQRHGDSILFILIYVPVTVIDFLTILAFFGGITYDPIYPSLQFWIICVQALLLVVPIALKIVDVRQNFEILRQSLKGIVADDRIADIAQRGIQLVRKPTSQYVTVVFVDFVGYSHLFRVMSPNNALNAVKSALAELTAIVHRHNGVVDKSLGDGILAFFGYDLGGRTIAHHEENALQCAMEMQRHLLIKSLDQQWVVFPLRIGINSAEILIGNVGNEYRLDLTLSGAGVILASRLEAACEPFKIILSESTFKHCSAPRSDTSAFNKILVPVKHEDRLCEAYECDPFRDQLELVRKGREHYRSQYALKVGIARQRFSASIMVRTPFGPMRILNFSVGGMRLQSNVRLARGVEIELWIALEVESEVSDLLNPIMVEVVWGTECTEDVFWLGVKLNAGNHNHGQKVFEMLKDLVSKKSGKSSVINVA